MRALSGDITAKQVLKVIINAEKEGEQPYHNSDPGILAGDIDGYPPNHDLKDPKSTTEWKTIDLSQEIAHYLKLHNQRHLGQAQLCPGPTSRPPHPGPTY
eukprot:8660630-Ditylum_brightwellii.AAC.1